MTKKDGITLDIIRQGDVLLRRVASSPEGAEPTENVLARGETTGHSHRVENGRVVRKGNQLLVLAEPETVLVHEEHRPVQIPQGVWEVVRQREYDPQQERQVSD